VISEYSLLGRDLHDLLHSSKLPRMTSRQYAAAVLLTFRDRKATLKQIVTAMLQWPAICKYAQPLRWKVSMILCEYPSRIPVAPDTDILWERGGQDTLELLRRIAEKLKNEKCWYREDFEFEGKTPRSDPEKYLEWAATKGKDSEEEEKDLEGEGCNIDYTGDVWAEEFDGDWWMDQRAGDRSPKRVVTLLKHGEVCAFEDYLPERNIEAPTFPHWHLLSTEIKLMVLGYAFVFPFPLMVIPKYTLTGREPKTHAEELSNMRFDFDIKVKAPFGLVETTRFWDLSVTADRRIYRVMVVRGEKRCLNVEDHKDERGTDIAPMCFSDRTVEARGADNCVKVVAMNRKRLLKVCKHASCSPPSPRFHRSPQHPQCAPHQTRDCKRLHEQQSRPASYRTNIRSRQHPNDIVHERNVGCPPENAIHHAREEVRDFPVAWSRSEDNPTSHKPHQRNQKLRAPLFRGLANQVLGHNEAQNPVCNEELQIYLCAVPPAVRKNHSSSNRLVPARGPHAVPRHGVGLVHICPDGEGEHRGGCYAEERVVAAARGIRKLAHDWGVGENDEGGYEGHVEVRVAVAGLWSGY